MAASRAELVNEDRIRASWSELAKGTLLSRGSGAETEVDAVVFFDYECPYWRTHEAKLRRLMEEDASIAVVLRHYPLPEHTQARAAARAAVCAENQGAFLALHDWLLTTSEWRLGRDWAEVAEEAGLQDRRLFEDCLESDAPDARISLDQAIAARFEVRATPTMLFRNGRTLVGGASIEELAARFRDLR